MTSIRFYAAKERNIKKRPFVLEKNNVLICIVKMNHWDKKKVKFS
jgi:hypothetical protein